MRGQTARLSHVLSPDASLATGRIAGEDPKGPTVEKTPLDAMGLDPQSALGHTGGIHKRERGPRNQLGRTRAIQLGHKRPEALREGIAPEMLSGDLFFKVAVNRP